jgi:transposase
MRESVTHICIDDFALRKGRRYGSLMVDLNTNRIIDIAKAIENSVKQHDVKSQNY